MRTGGKGLAGRRTKRRTHSFVEWLGLEGDLACAELVHPEFDVPIEDPRVPSAKERLGQEGLFRLFARVPHSAALQCPHCDQGRLAWIKHRWRGEDRVDEHERGKEGRACSRGKDGRAAAERVTNADDQPTAVCPLGGNGRTRVDRGNVVEQTQLAGNVRGGSRERVRVGAGAGAAGRVEIVRNKVEQVTSVLGPIVCGEGGA